MKAVVSGCATLLTATWNVFFTLVLHSSEAMISQDRLSMANKKNYGRQNNGKHKKEPDEEYAISSLSRG